MQTLQNSLFPLKLKIYSVCIWMDPEYVSIKCLFFIGLSVCCHSQHQNVLLRPRTGEDDEYVCTCIHATRGKIRTKTHEPPTNSFYTGLFLKYHSLYFTFITIAKHQHSLPLLTCINADHLLSNRWIAETVAVHQ